jgi:hypothetical protein
MVAVISQATSAAEITDQSHSNAGSPTNTPAMAINVIAAIKIIQRLFTFIQVSFCYLQSAKILQNERKTKETKTFCVLKY